MNSASLILDSTEHFLRASFVSTRHWEPVVSGLIGIKLLWRCWGKRCPSSHAQDERDADALESSSPGPIKYAWAIDLYPASRGGHVRLPTVYMCGNTGQGPTLSIETTATSW